jgi:hypothetical protein
VAHATVTLLTAEPKNAGAGEQENIENANWSDSPMKSISAFLLVLIASATGTARIITVDDDGRADFSTIQAAIDDANDGDTVEIRPGVYTGDGNRDIDFLGKAITVRSTDPANANIVADTIIDCQGAQEDGHRGFYFHSGEDSNSVLCGVTVINGYVAQNGGGIECRDYSDPRIVNCVIAYNSAERGGGGGIDCDQHSDPRIENSIIIGNSAHMGGGIMSKDGSRPRIVNCTIFGNVAKYGGGIACYSVDSTIVINCIIRGNTPSRMSDYYSAGLVVRYSNIEGGFPGAGNIDADPVFVDSNGGDFHISAGSPCIDAGDPDHSPYEGKIDIDGDPRISKGRIDIGADEFCDGPLLAVRPSGFDFFAYEGGAGPASETFSICNRGSECLEWQLAEGCEWLEVSRQAGLSCDEPNYVELGIDISDMPGGYYNCDLTISDREAVNSPRTIPVALHVLGPVLEVSASKIEFWAVRGGANPGDQSFTVRNSGGGTLNWVTSGANDCNWLEVAPASGSSGGETTEAVLSVDISGVGNGAHTCLLEVCDPGAAESPKTVTVVLHIYDELPHVPAQYPTIQEAIDHALEGSTIVVADGVYSGEGNRDIDFRGKAITVQSEKGAATCIIDCNGTQEQPHRGFYFHSGEDANSTIIGLTITKGYADIGGGILCNDASPSIVGCVITLNSARTHDNSEGGRGGGIYCDKASPSVIDCLITHNIAFEAFGGGYGGGIYCDDSNALIAGCTLSNNEARHGQGEALFGGLGGAIYSQGGSPVISNCPVSDNHAGPYDTASVHCYGGGPTITGCTISDRTWGGRSGIRLSYCKPEVRDCTIRNNSRYGIMCEDVNDGIISGCKITDNLGPAVQSEASNLVITNCLIADNRGAIHCVMSGVEIRNCTIADNGDWGEYGAVFCEGECSCSVTGSILWGNRTCLQPECRYPQVYCMNPEVNYSCIEGWYAAWGGVGNYGADPRFADPEGGDYHLKSQAGRWDVNEGRWTIDELTSPCIDAGDVMSPVGREPFPNGGRINMGAYGGTVEASKTYFGRPPCETALAPDINGDCEVDFEDFKLMALHWCEDNNP